MKNYITFQTLEGAWLRGVKHILRNGKAVTGVEPFFEVTNLYVSYSNSFETDVPSYKKIFDDTFLKYMERVYSKLGDVESGRNYYNLIYNQKGINQVDKVISILTKDPLSRSGIIVLSSPGTDKKPCVSEISFSIRGNLLHMTVIFKSSDFAKKFIPDMVELSKVHAKISRSLNISRGEVSALILCAQLYNSDKKILSDVIAKLKNSIFFKTDKVIENWDKEAVDWDKNINNPSHYVNFEDGYGRFLKFVNSEVPPVKHGSFKIALDSGCGTGAISEALNKKGYNAIGLDLSPKMIEHAHKHKNMRKYVLANSLDIPYEENSFDIICSRGVLLSHVGKRYVNLFIKEHLRVLKPGGLFVFDFITHFNASEVKKKKAKASVTFSEASSMVTLQGFKVIGRSGEDANRVNAIICKK